MAHVELDPAFRTLIDPAEPVRKAAGGFIFTEGPIWHPVQQFLAFSDMPGDVRRRLDDAGVSEIARPSNKGNGMTYDAALNLLVCEHATSSVARIGPDGQREVLASHFEGRELNSPNDIVVHSDGSIWFSDPWYGRMPHFGIDRPRDLGWQGVFRLKPNHRPGDAPELVVDRYTFSQPNGLCFSPDERRLYINDTEQANIRVYDVLPGGRLENGRIFASGLKDPSLAGLPDGMKCDAAGNVWCCGPGGLWVFAPSGKLLGKVLTPEMPANFHWGGPDWRRLYICAETSVYQVTTKIGPRPEPFMKAGAGQGRTSQADGYAALGTRDSASPHGGAYQAPASHAPHPAPSANPSMHGEQMLTLDPARCALIIQDMQNDVVIEGGAFAASGSPAHCRQQNAIPNIARLAARCRALGVPVIHVWFVRRADARDMTLNAPLFENAVDSNALVEGTWGAAPAAGLEPHPEDHIVRKARMSAWEGTSLERILKAEGRDILIETGAWTNMSIEHTARTGADKGYVMIIPEDGCSTMNADWHNASINYAMQNVALVTKTDEVLAALG